MTSILSSEIKLKKNFYKIGKQNWLKKKNMIQRDALNTKNYILAHQKIYFSDGNFFVGNSGEKNFF